MAHSPDLYMQFAQSAQNYHRARMELLAIDKKAYDKHQAAKRAKLALADGKPTTRLEKVKKKLSSMWSEGVYYFLSERLNIVRG